MTQLLLFNVTNGLIIGAFYVLMALGLSLILNLSNVINFAHGGFLVIGGYIACTITPYIGFWGALNAMRDSIVFFSTPAAVAEKHIPAGKRFRLSQIVALWSCCVASARKRHRCPSFKVRPINKESC